MKAPLRQSLRVCVFLLSAIVLGTSYRTIVIDGTNDFASDESFAASSPGCTWYVTWDADNVYVGVASLEIQQSAGSTSKWVLCYFDTDPQPVATGGTGTRNGQMYNTQQPLLPFTANYHLRWRFDDTYIDLQTFNGSTWQSASQTGIQRSRSGSYLEIKIPRANLGSPDRIYFCADMINEQGGSEWTYYLVPSLHTDGYDVNFTHYYGFTLDAGRSPNDAANLDAPLAVQLKTFTASSLPAGQVRLEWTTLSETNNYGFEVQKSSSRATGYQSISPLIPGHLTTVAPHTYSFVDTSWLQGRFYRLKQIDLDLSVHYTEPIEAGTMGVNEERTEGYALAQNFPNPFNPATVVRYQLSAVSDVRLVVCDILGQEVAVLVDEKKGPGRYEVKVDGSGLASGVYFYRLQTGDYVATKKMLLMK